MPKDTNSRPQKINWYQQKVMDSVEDAEWLVLDDSDTDLDKLDEIYTPKYHGVDL